MFAVFTVLLIGLSLFSFPSLALGVQDSELTIDLPNQDPDPVKPGDVLGIRLSVRNMNMMTPGQINRLL